MPDATCVRKSEDEILIIGNLRRNDKKNKSSDTRYNKPYLPWLISVFDVSSELNMVHNDLARSLTKTLSLSKIKTVEMQEINNKRASVQNQYSNDYLIKISTDLQFGAE
jgi:hypothetical protein